MKRILIADDEPNILLSLDFLMRKNGYEVFIARDGKEAVDIIQDKKPQAVILDIMMPEMDGYEVCQFIRKDEDLKHIKVIFLTAKTQPADIAKGLTMADSYITKPFSTKDIVKEVESLI
ncbi:response regulator transcription factor [Bernardetia sp.]|uniref:response regulator transcription factor n=1 Tax=Bernardetia sp. TaxID=1937974 RepID=UPI0025BD320C|nr:response regulator [Bernardetia sp.]